MLFNQWMDRRRKLSAKQYFSSVKNIVKVKVGVAAKVGWKTDLDEWVLTMIDGAIWLTRTCIQ